MQISAVQTLESIRSVFAEYLYVRRNLGASAVNGKILIDSNGGQKSPIFLKIVKAAEYIVDFS